VEENVLEDELCLPDVSLGSEGRANHASH